MNATYLLPIRLLDARPIDALVAYLRSLSGVEIVVVDGSAPGLFAALDSGIADLAIHVPPDPRIGGRNGKARGVLTGLGIATHDKIVVADDDVRYDAHTLSALAEALDRWDVVRPQNYFAPRPWHAIVDGARSLMNRALDETGPARWAFASRRSPTDTMPTSCLRTWSSFERFAAAAAANSSPGRSSSCVVPPRPGTFGSSEYGRPTMSSRGRRGSSLRSVCFRY